MTDKRERPTEGGCYVRGKDGRLEKVTAHTQPAPGKQEAAKAEPAKPEAPKPATTQQNEG